MSLFDRELPPPPSPQIFFRQAPFNVLPEDRLPDDDRDINVRSPEVFSSPNSPNADYDSSHMPMHLPATVMDRYRRGSLTSSDCTRRSIISAQDEHFTPVRNLAILKYQRRSIFSPRITSDNSNREESLGMGQCWPCSAVLWRGHEKLCIGSVFLAFCLIIIGGIVGMYFACMFVRTGAMLPVNQEIQHSPRIGVRISTEENSMGNDLSPPLVPLHPIQRIPAMDMEPSIGEVDCNELYTFRCGVNQCLPIPVWCDGKVDCDDRTDEQNECSLNCPPRFFACLNHSSVRFDKTHDWCIPETLVCNGVADCDDLSDEYFCRCNAEQIRCTDGICKNRTEICRGADACVSDTSEALHCNCLDDLTPHKFCDGFPDCADNLDEIECSANCDANDQFACWRSGYGCVHKTSVCDGIRDCSNGEDEEECMRLLADGDTMPESVDYIGLARPAGVLLIRRWSIDFFPICLSSAFDFQADPDVGTTFCNHFGYARLLYAEPLLLPVTPPNSNTKFFNFSPQFNGGDPSRFFVPIKNCQSGNVLRIHCTEMMCEPRLYRNKGVIVTENGQLLLKRQEQFFPFIAQIYKRVWSSWVLRCGGVVVHPLWLITSSGCIDKNGYFKTLAGPYWQSTNPKLMQSRDITMIAMPPETPALQGNSELVLARLDRRLECHDYLRPICLPDATNQNTRLLNVTTDFAHCVTLGWNVTSNRASNIPYPSELHVARDVHIVPSEDCSRSLYNGVSETADLLICVRIPNRESTNLLSDHGGVLACSSADGSKWDLVGVLAGYKTRVAGNYVRVYALYTRVNKHLNWILRELSNSDAMAP